MNLWTVTREILINSKHQPILLELFDQRTKSIESSTHWSELILNINLLLTKINKTQVEVSPLGEIAFTSDQELVNLEEREATKILRGLVPWRMGPFKVFNEFIDGEWLSNLQFNRLSKVTDNLHDKVIADVGASAGYHSFRFLNLGAKAVYAFDPIARCQLQLTFLKELARVDKIIPLPFGVEELHLFPDYFDQIFCLGVLYHQRDPLWALNQLKKALKVGGTLVLESLTVPDQKLEFYEPQSRYCKMRNCWHVQTPESLKELLLEAGFSNVSLLYSKRITIEEQRRTVWAPFESLKDFLNPEENTKTIEGYPAPFKTAYVATK